jgi:hypothetical protein
MEKVHLRTVKFKKSAKTADVVRTLHRVEEYAGQSESNNQIHNYYDRKKNANCSFSIPNCQGSDS